MIVEAAFLKLPELLETSAGSRHVTEATVVHTLTTALMMELNVRNIPHPTKHVVEKPSTLAGPGSSYNADLYVDLHGAVSRPELVAGYGYRKDCWLEAKTFGMRPQERRRSEDVGRVVRDILRVCIFPEESQGRFRDNARYLLIVSGVEPAQFWNGAEMREWINALTEPGEQNVSFQ